MLDKILITLAWFVVVPTTLLIFLQVFQVAYAFTKKATIRISLGAIIPWIVAGLCWGYITAK